MKKITIILALLIGMTSIAQQKIFFDKDWKRTTNQQNAEYYRLVHKEKNGLFAINDYYINGTSQMKAHMSNPEKSSFEGVATWYDKKGRKTYSATYLHNRMHGKITQYLTSGEVMIEGYYKNGKPHHGIFKEYHNFAEMLQPNNDYEDIIQTYYEYKDGKSISDLFYYKDSKKLALKKIEYAKGEFYDRWYFYNKKGKEIGQVVWKRDKSGKSGTMIIFYVENYEIIGIQQKRVYVKNIITKETVYKKNGQIWSHNKYIVNKKYRDNIAYEGSFIEGNELNTYHKGKIAKSVQYNNEGFNKPLATIYYRNEKPYQGILYKSYNKGNFIITYNKGKAVQEKCYFDNDFKIIKHHKYITKQRKLAIDWYNNKGKLLGAGHYEGDIIIDGLDVTDNIQTHYRDEERHGMQRKYSLVDPNFLIRESLLQNDTIVWSKTTNPFKKNKVLYMEYHNSLPYNGEIFVKYQNGYKYKQYKNGYVKLEIYYETKYDYKQDGDSDSIEEEHLVIEETDDISTESTTNTEKAEKGKCYLMLYPNEQHKYSTIKLCEESKYIYKPNSFEYESYIIYKN